MSDSDIRRGLILVGSAIAGRKLLGLVAAFVLLALTQSIVNPDLILYVISCPIEQLL